MRILIIGQNSKIADVFCRFASVIMVVDKNIEDIEGTCIITQNSMDLENFNQSQ